MAGGLVSLGPDYSAMTRQAVAQVDKIIKGENPGEGLSLCVREAQNVVVAEVGSC